MNKHVALYGLVLAGCLVGASANAAVNAFLIIDGLQGPSTSKQSAIDILSFSWGASNPVNVTNANVTCAGLSITKKVDRASPVLAEHSKSGVKYKKAVISVVEAGTSADSVVMTMEGVSMVPGKAPISSGEAVPTESYFLHFSRIRVSYPSASAKAGGAAGAGRAPITLNCN
jgi:type VI secretion system secreted protein Hcp